MYYTQLHLPLAMKLQHVRILMALVVATIGCFLSHTLAAQGSSKITLKAGQTPDKKEYLHPAFMSGKVQFANGGTNTSLLNYNLLTGDIEFINRTGDTLALDNLGSINTITLGEVLFVHDPVSQNLLIKVEEFKDFNLFVKQKYELKDRKQIGAYGMPSTATSPTSVRDYMADNTMYRLNSNEDLVYAVEAIYFLQDRNKLFYPANKSNVLRLMASHKAKVEQFVKNNKIDFRKGEDLKMVLEYYSRL